MQNKLQNLFLIALKMHNACSSVEKITRKKKGKSCGFT